MHDGTDRLHLSSLPIVCVPFPPPPPASSSSDPSCLPLCLHRGCAELTFLLRCSSFCVDIHINYPDCQEHLSGVTILLSTSLCVIINDFIGIRETTYGKCVCHTSGLNGEVPSQPPGREEEEVEEEGGREVWKGVWRPVSRLGGERG